MIQAKRGAKVAIVMFSTIRRIETIFIATAVTACSTPKQAQFGEELSAGRCEQAMGVIPEQTTGVRLVSETQRTAGMVSKYAFIGASYTAEVLWDVTSGAVMAVALCGPVVVAIAATTSGPNTSQLTCLPGKFDALAAPPLGRKAIKHSAKWDCPPSLSEISASLRRVALCFESRGGSDDLMHARQTLESIKDSKDFYRCMPESERDNLEQQLDQVSRRMAG